MEKIFVLPNDIQREIEFSSNISQIGSLHTKDINEKQE
jgi:hypothetical protein